MLVRDGKIICDHSEMDVLSTPVYEICWRGLVYKDGFEAGAASLGELAKVREAEIPRAAAELKGDYFVAMRHKGSGNCYAFVDHCGLYHAYYSSHFVSTSFLNLSRIEGYKSDDFDPEAVVEFFHFGCIHEDKTFFRAIRKIEPDAIVRCTPSGSAAVLPKPIPDMAEPSQRSFTSVLWDFASAVRVERLSLDITGGVDSRLLAAAFSYFGLPFEMAASGRPGIRDIELAARVAQVLGKPFYPTYHEAERSDWDQLFLWSDGMLDVTKNSRLMQLQQDRRGRGVTLSVSGIGGELFRDVWWLQDFPFYSRPKPRLGRLYSFRVAGQGLDHSLLADPYKALSQHYRERLLCNFSRYVVPGNTRTYDRVYYHYRMRGLGGSFVTSSNPIVKVGAPYLDPEAVRLGYSLSRFQRCFNVYHRRMITRYSVEASRLPTTEGGMSSSWGPKAITLDLACYVADRCTRLANKIGERLVSKAFFGESPDDPRMAQELRRVLANRRTAELLADHGVFAGAMGVQALPERYLGSIFVLGRLFQELDQPNNAQPVKTVAASASFAEKSP